MITAVGEKNRNRRSSARDAAVPAGERDGGDCEDAAIGCRPSHTQATSKWPLPLPPGTDEAALDVSWRLCVRHADPAQAEFEKLHSRNFDAVIVAQITKLPLTFVPQEISGRALTVEGVVACFSASWVLWRHRPGPFQVCQLGAHHRVVLQTEPLPLLDACIGRAASMPPVHHRIAG